MENRWGEVAYNLTCGAASAYYICQKMVSKIGSQLEKSPPDAVKRSSGWFTGIMADMNNDSEGSESIKDGENRGSKHHATIEGYAEGNSDWLLVGPRRASYEQTLPVVTNKETRELGPEAPKGMRTPSTSQRSLKISPPLDIEDTPSYDRKCKRYISMIDGIDIPEISQQSDKKHYFRDLEDKYTRNRNSGLDLLMSMADIQMEAEMDALIEHLKKFTVRGFQTTVDAYEQPEPEGSESGSDGTIFRSETTATDDDGLGSWDCVPKPAGEASNPSSSSPFDKILASNLLGKKLKAKVQELKKLFKKQANNETPTYTRFVEPYRYYTLGRHV